MDGQAQWAGQKIAVSISYPKTRQPKIDGQAEWAD